MSLASLFALSCALHLYIGLRLLPALQMDAAAAAGAVLLLAQALLMPMGLVARRFARGAAADRLTWAGMLALGLFSSLLVLTVLRDLLLGAAWAAAASVPVAPAALRRASAWASLGGALTLTAWGLFNARRRPRIVQVRVPIAGLHPALQGLRIVQISDIHVGPTIKRETLQAIVDDVNAQQPDLVAVTGDLVDGSVAELVLHVAPLGGLRARHGSFFVTGNHEYYAGAHAWIAQLRRLGLQVLMNEHVVLRHGGAALVLAGVPDFSAGHFDPAHRPDPAAALHGAPRDLPKVLLAHQPRSATAAATAGFDLQLSGHTHGGQFWPWNLFVPLQQPYTAGLHRLGRLWVYVSRGTGYWGPPKRVGAPSEITVLTLVSE